MLENIMPLVLNKIKSNRAPLNEESLSRFLSYCEKRKYPKKGIIFREGDPANSLYYIIEGSVSVSSNDETGSEIVLTYLHKGEFIGEIGLFITDSERSAMVRARTECELAEISYDRFNELVQKELREDHAEILNTVGFQLSPTHRRGPQSQRVGDPGVAGATESHTHDRTHGGTGTRPACAGRWRARQGDSGADGVGRAWWAAHLDVAEHDSRADPVRSRRRGEDHDGP